MAVTLTLLNTNPRHTQLLIFGRSSLYKNHPINHIKLGPKQNNRRKNKESKLARNKPN